MPEGKVKWFDEIKGYGFIKTDEGGELFVHHKSIQADGFRVLQEGQRVSFNIGKGKKGRPAVENVRLV